MPSSAIPAKQSGCRLADQQGAARPSPISSSMLVANSLLTATVPRSARIPSGARSRRRSPRTKLVMFYGGGGRRRERWRQSQDRTHIAGCLRAGDHALPQAPRLETESCARHKRESVFFTGEVCGVHVVIWAEQVPVPQKPKGPVARAA